MNYDNEEWRPVVGYEVHYEVSNAGRIRKVKSNSIVVPHLLNNRRVVYLYNCAKRKIIAYALGRLVWKAFADDGIISSTLVMHSDGDVTNCSINNLYAMPRRELCKRAKHYSINKVDDRYRLRVRSSSGKWLGRGYYDSRRLAARAANEIITTGVITVTSKKRKSASKYDGVTMSKSTGHLKWIVQYKGKYVASFRCEHIAGFVSNLVQSGAIPPDSFRRNSKKRIRRDGKA